MNTRHIADMGKLLRRIAGEVSATTPEDVAPTACLLLILHENESIEIHAAGDIDRYRAVGMLDHAKVKVRQA